MNSKKVCVVIGASQAGVTFSFALRHAGWNGEIILFDKDPELPYYRPPLSKSVLTGIEDLSDHILKPVHLYDQERIIMKSGVSVVRIDRNKKSVIIENGTAQQYDKLVLATGSRPVFPPIPGINSAKNIFSLRTSNDVAEIHNALDASEQKRVVIIGGGYIGLETAASLQKIGADVTVIERENRVLKRVTAPVMSEFFQNLHVQNGVKITTSTNVVSLKNSTDQLDVLCDNGTQYKADLVIVGTGIKVNQELAAQAGLDVSNGIEVDSTTQTSDKDIYAIGDCSFHFNPHYNRFLRLESIQNANDQAKVAAAVICGEDTVYNTIPWFWSDQYDVKLQIVGLSDGYTETVIRKEKGREDKFSVWYFKNDDLLAVDAVNDMKAYVLGSKFIKGRNRINKSNLANPDIDAKPVNLLME